MPKTHEFRVREVKVKRYFVTEFLEDENGRTSEVVCENVPLGTANAIADALAAMYDAKAFQIEEEA